MGGDETKMKKIVLLGFLLVFPDLFWGMTKIGLGCWGFSQRNAYGNVSGSILVLSGTVQFINIRW
jgi:hypothetical protein